MQKFFTIQHLYRFCSYTTADSSKIQLLKLCSQAEVPLYFFDSVLKWAAASPKPGAVLSTGCQTRKKNLTDLSSQYKMKELQPIQRSILLSDGITVMPVTCFNFLELIHSLLDDKWQMTKENCLFSFKDPCAIQM